MQNVDFFGALTIFFIIFFVMVASFMIGADWWGLILVCIVIVVGFAFPTLKDRFGPGIYITEAELRKERPNHELERRKTRRTRRG